MTHSGPTRRSSDLGGKSPRGEPRILLDHGDGPEAGMAAGQQGGEGDQLAAEDHRAPERALAGEIDQRLQGAGGDHAEWALAADQAGGAAAFAHTDRKSVV